jgi:hypothetical protein
MATTTSSERLLKKICGSCLILAPAVLLVGGLIHPEETTDEARQFRIIAADLGRWELAHWLICGAMVLMVGAVVGLAHVLRGTRPTEGIVGGAATVVGVMALLGIASVEAAAVPQIVGSDAPGAEQVFGDFFLSGQQWALQGPVILLPLGLIIMSYGLYAGKLAQAWVAACVAVGSVAFAIALPTGSAVAFAIGLFLIFVGLARVGVSVLSESDEQWNHPPQIGAQPAV